MKFSQDQINAVEGICAELVHGASSEYHSIAVLTGSAGTGKTTVVRKIIDKIETESPLTTIALCATTHRAALVLEEITSQKVTTAHALFKLRPTATRTGKEVLTQTSKCDIPVGSLVIIDEASMIGNEFLKAIVDIVKDKSLKILFIGDPFQLPPPKDKCSIFDGSLYTFKLTTIHRQAGGNPVLDKANEFREYMEGSRLKEPVIETCINSKGEGIHVLSHEDFISKFVAKYIDYSAGAEVDTPLCTFTNESAINYNNMVRKAAFFLDDVIEPFYEGERLISNTAVMEQEKTILTNNEIVHVQNFQEGTEHTIPGYHITVHGTYDKYLRSSTKKIFSPKTKHAADIVLSELKKEAIHKKCRQTWKEFYAVKNSLADLRPPFAGTTHKAQGGTFPAVFIDKININKCRDPKTRARLFYVALTRATSNVYINS
jgi:exodeoxyribonuclease V